MDYDKKIASTINIRPEQAAAVIELLDQGNTLPFVARYRKEATGGLDEEQLRAVSEWLGKLRSLDERRNTVINSIEEQGKLTPELHQQLLEANSLTLLEDLYQPYKPKRRTRASIARDNGLQGLANLILQQAHVQESPEKIAQPYLSENVPASEDAWAGARDIVAETISDHAEVRRIARERALQWGVLHCEKILGAEDERRVYEVYYEYEGRVDRIRPHQVLAINRGEAEKVLRVWLDILERDWRAAIGMAFQVDNLSPLKEQLVLAVNDSAERLLLPTIERDVRRTLTQVAEEHAIGIFSANLRALISQSPLVGHVVMGIDPGFRTGSKVAIVDATGKVLDTATIYPHEPQNEKDRALKILATFVAKHRVTLIAIGNGTASRETEALVAELIAKMKVEGEKTKKDGNFNSRLEAEYQPGIRKIPQYLIVNEAGASVYSASKLARAELPGLDVSMRGAVSIARRIQDPLAELVKIDPKSIGVGLYQHDVDQKHLAESLNVVVESVVNNVGVDVNTASAALLTYVVGIGPKLSEKIVLHRDINGSFRNREDLRKVAGLGPKAFEQSAGFLRIRNSTNPLDASAIHPESYKATETVLELAGVSFQDPAGKLQLMLDTLQVTKPIDKLAQVLGIGGPTLTDIFEQLIRPGRDPRDDTPVPILRSDLLKLEDLTVGMQIKGTVRNVVDFGAFIDIGVKQDGLLHRSQIPPGITLQVGDVIDISIQKVEIERGRIGLGWVRSNSK